MVDRAWDLLANGKPQVTRFRLNPLNRRWTSPQGDKSDAWVISTCNAQLDDKGKVVSILGTVFDISDLKWAETMESRRKNEAIEAKRQQEK